MPENGVFIELGVAAGGFADQILEKHPTLQYIGIDRWSDHHDEVEMGKATRRLKKHSARKTQIIRDTFENARHVIQDQNADVVYVDGYAHTGQNNGKTLLEWWPKVKPGGVLAGHDYHERWHPTVKVVNTFAAGLGLPVEIIPDTPYPSWLIRKPAFYEPVPGTLLNPNDSAVLIGNGPSVLLQELGEHIDSFAEIIRFNEYQTQCFEKYCGSRTTIWSTYGKNKFPRDANPSFEKCVFIHGSRGDTSQIKAPAWRLPISHYWNLRDRVRQSSSWTEENKTKLIPSSGLTVALWLLEVLEIKQLHFVGLDHFNRDRTYQHHYFSPKRYLEPREHDGSAEQVLLSPYIQSGRLIPLSLR